MVILSDRFFCQVLQNVVRDLSQHTAVPVACMRCVSTLISSHACIYLNDIVRMWLKSKGKHLVVVQSFYEYVVFFPSVIASWFVRLLLCCSVRFCLFALLCHCFLGCLLFAWLVGCLFVSLLTYFLSFSFAFYFGSLAVKQQQQHRQKQKQTTQHNAKQSKT